MDAFAGLASIAELPVRGPTRAAAVKTTGVHVDLRVVPPDVWGAALLYFTGSKAHNIHLRRLAQRSGTKLSEYGLSRNGHVLAAATETEVYAQLGMAYVPPTLREDRGEIEAALDGSLPHLVEIDAIRGDLHTHTDLTDGLASMEEMAAAARARGYRYTAVTDHAPLLSMQRMTTEKALAQRAALRALSGRGGLTLLHGSELNIQTGGTLDWDDEFLSHFDVLVGRPAFVRARSCLPARDTPGAGRPRGVAPRGSGVSYPRRPSTQPCLRPRSAARRTRKGSGRRRRSPATLWRPGCPASSRSRPSRVSGGPAVSAATAVSGTGAHAHRSAARGARPAS